MALKVRVFLVHMPRKHDALEFFAPAVNDVVDTDYITNYLTEKGHTHDPYTAHPYDIVDLTDYVCSYGLGKAKSSLLGNCLEKMNRKEFDSVLCRHLTKMKDV